MDVWRRRLEAEPATIAVTIREMMARALATDPQQGQDALEFLRRFGTLKNHGDLAHCITMMAEVWNACEAGNYELAHAKCGLGLMAMDQASQDSRWEAGLLMAHSVEPSLEATGRYPMRTALRSYSRLADPRWVAAAQSHIREGAQLSMAYKSLGKGGGKKGKGDDGAAASAT